MIFARLLGQDSKAIHSESPFRGFGPTPDTAELLTITTYMHTNGTFKSVTRTTAGTSQLVTPLKNGSLLLTDLLISGEKQVSSTVEVRFTDDVQTVSIFLASQVDAPAQIAHNFAGRFQGWRDARIDVVTSGTADATVTLGYVKLPTGLPYQEWDSKR